MSRTAESTGDFDAVSRVLDAFRAGEPVLVHDFDDREGETDLVYPAGAVTPADVGRMRNDAGGLVCVALPNDVSESLGLPFIDDVLDHPAASSHDLAYDSRSSFSFTVNHRDSFTGITDRDRAMTISRLAPVAEASLVQTPTPLQWGMPTFQTSFVIGMFAGVVASMIESFGDYHAVARLAGERAPSARRIDHGIGMEGVATVFAGIMGTGNGSTSYSENIGAIGLTGVASRFVIQVGAVLMLIVGFLGPFGALITTIPDPIVGGLYVAMFGQIAAVGLSNLKHVDLDSSRNAFIVGISLFLGLALPAYMGNVGSAVAFQQGVANTPVVGAVLTAPVLPAATLQIVADTVYVVGGTGMAVGGLVAFVLDNTVDGTRAERGLDEWEALTEESGAFRSAYERYVEGD